MLREAGFDTVEMGPTGHRALVLVRDRKSAGQPKKSAA
jgi:hypothetical protein